MLITPYHAKYFAHELTRRRPSFEDARLSGALFDASVDLNPHQIEAALFALRSPLSKGSLLADEVGLGKTIEAALVLCQYWAERRRRLLVICPASLRKQWGLELEEKFNLPMWIADSPSYNQALREGVLNPFQSPKIVICSLHFASAYHQAIREVGWDLVVIDEAHKLRNAYRASNKMGQRLRRALEDRKKLLLTATPLQNSLLELFGLSTLLDENLFGDIGAFRGRYMRQDSDLGDLQGRLSAFCKRTLRNQVTEYVPYTERKALTVPFSPSDDECALYEAVSAFLRREDTFSLPSRQRTLLTLILRKLLSSSSLAIAGTLDMVKGRLVRMREGMVPEDDLLASLISGEEIETDYLEEGEEESSSAEGAEDEEASERAHPDLTRINAEIEEVSRLAVWARAIRADTKARALLEALKVGFAELQKVSAPRKAVLFTESVRTLTYVKAFLEANGYAGQVVAFTGTNNGPEAKAIYESWLKTNRDTGRASGSRAVDQRTALIEHFRDHAQILVATEAGAEGINLQFCSLVINYDLPWNPQRIEQRIGRCHRYGQKHDVVVVNFLNERNEADRRVLELLTEKFDLFSGVFGASDEVLGAIESGVDFEKRILAIYQTCRTLQEIQEAFEALQREMAEAIAGRMTETRRVLLEHFDEDVHARLRTRLDETRAQLDQVGRQFWTLTRFILDGRAKFDNAAFAFDLAAPPIPEVPPGRYHLISKEKPDLPSAYLYRLSHPLGAYALAEGKAAATPTARVIFDATHHPTRIAAVEALAGKRGVLLLQRLEVDSFEREEYLLFSGLDVEGHPVDPETVAKLFRCGARVEEDSPPAQLMAKLEADAERHAEAAIAHSFEENNGLFQKERERLERWAEDMVYASEKELADTKAQLKALARQARLAVSVEEQLAIQSKTRELERLQRRQRQRIFDVEDEIHARRDRLIEVLERRLSQRTARETLFTIEWAVV